MHKLLRVGDLIDIPLYWNAFSEVICAHGVSLQCYLNIGNNDNYYCGLEQIRGEHVFTNTVTSVQLNRYGNISKILSGSHLKLTHVHIGGGGVNNLIKYNLCPPVLSA